MIFGVAELEPSNEPDCITLEMPEYPDEFPHCKMGCGHVFSSETIRELIIRQVKDEKRHEIRCPALKEGRAHGICNAPWVNLNFPDYFCMTGKEENEFTQCLSENIHLYVLNYVQCPTCQALIPRPSDDPKLTRTHCDNCEEIEGAIADFCHKCGQEWKYDEICLSDVCTFKKQNAILQECIEIEVDYVTVPTVRACPRCNTLYEHMEACRHMKCLTLKCKDEEFEYCHICLSDWSEHDHDRCAAAPRQFLQNPYIKEIEELKLEEESEKQRIQPQNNVDAQVQQNRIEDEDNEIIAEVMLDQAQVNESEDVQKDQVLFDQSKELGTDQTDYNDHYQYSSGMQYCSIF
ncbi:hypothetical protein FGO68_gene14832 [Halteria grandinella]|uniref:RING-type domain-containing protein n=1 Tax=Halteria grandinella TaxID=5974 RepID=A0A8J8NT33_HALGN|nr:hypothetical protein FGO68_gene14832 [Halteria grandinella]